MASADAVTELRGIYFPLLVGTPWFLFWKEQGNGMFTQAGPGWAKILSGEPLRYNGKAVSYYSPSVRSGAGSSLKFEHQGQWPVDFLMLTAVAMHQVRRRINLHTSLLF